MEALSLVDRWSAMAGRLAISTPEDLPGERH